MFKVFDFMLSKRDIQQPQAPGETLQTGPSQPLPPGAPGTSGLVPSQPTTTGGGGGETGRVILKHTGNVTDQNKSNTEYNSGVVAGREASQGINFTSDLKCPADRSKSFCLGWNQTACNSSGCGGDYTCDNPVQPPGAKGCTNDKGYKG